MAAFTYDDNEDCLIADDPIDDCPWGVLTRRDTLRENLRLVQKIRRRRVDKAGRSDSIKVRRQHVQG